MAAGAVTPVLVARVLPDLTGLDKQFDYAVPAEMAGRIDVGTLVRVELHGRRVGGWVLELLDEGASDVAPEQLKPIAKVTGRGPDRTLIELAEWASVRWAARRLRPFLVTASPHRVVGELPPPHRTAVVPGPQSPATSELLEAGGGVLRLPPRADVFPSLLSAAAHGPALVVVPAHADAVLTAARLRRAGLEVAVVPDDWAAGAAGVDVVIGARSAAWAPCAGMASGIVVDEHDEALQEERAPTWHARDVLAERCRRAGVPLVAISPAPTLVAAEELTGGRGVVHPPPERERRGWPVVTVVDRAGEEPWTRSLVTSALIERIRDRSSTVVCVSNTSGRARLLACRSCHVLQRCEHCDATVRLTDDHRLVCGRCGTERPSVCQACGASRLANLRPGVTRLREELEAAAARAVVAVTGREPGPPPPAGVYVGTEAVLHRVHTADVVAFLEFDAETLAPRFRAAEEALVLVVRAARLAPEVLLQTFHPEHEVIRAAVAADPSIVLDAERPRRRLLALPPYGALAVVSGTGAEEFVRSLDDRSIGVGGGPERWFVRGDDWMALGRALNAAPRPAGARLRIEVDPPRI